MALPESVLGGQSDAQTSKPPEARDGTFRFLPCAVVFTRHDGALLACSPKMRAGLWASRAPSPVSCPQPSVVDRMASLPLISSTCEMVSAAYTSTKDRYPHVRTVCDVAEKGVKTLTAAAVSGAQPILSKLEPQSELRTPGCGECFSWPFLEGGDSSVSLKLALGGSPHL